MSHLPERWEAIGREGGILARTSSSRFLLRSELKGDASQAIRAAEVLLPPVLQEIA